MDGRTLRFEARVERNIMCDTVDLYAIIRSEHGVYMVDGARMVSPGEALGAPTLQLSQAGAQQLMDDLWRVGVRPTEGKVSDRTLQAQEDHIKSLQAVTKHLLELEKLRI